MSDWRSRYSDKLVSAEEAVAPIAAGAQVRLPMGPVPVTLIEALARRGDELRDLTVVQGASRHPHPWSQGSSEWRGRVQFVSDFLSPMLRAGMDARETDFAVTDYSVSHIVRAADGSPAYDRRDSFTPDVFLALVSEPDADGMVSFGYSRWHSKELLEVARYSVAEVGSDVLRPCGDTRVPLASFDRIVVQSAPPMLVPPPQLTDARIEVTEVIGAYVSTLVNDGDTIQVGTGTLSSCMGSYLTEKSDLGVDAEILVASVVELVKSGVATGVHKTHKPGVATASFIVPGCDFAYCDENPKIELHPISWCNNVNRISTIRNLIAINQASMIDLTGQAASESIGPAMFTGSGGQLVWSMGALYAPGGRAVLVLPSTARSGSVSRIVSAFDPGTIVTVPRTFVDFVVTEHGIANLQGLTQRQRALALIELAHPDHRDRLRSDARRLFWP